MISERADQIGAGGAFLALPGFVPGFDTFVKLEGLNPVGSIKLKPAREMIADAESRAMIWDGVELIDSTSGNIGIALASICAAKGYRITLVTDPNANMRAVRYMRALGAHVVVVNERDERGGYLQTRIDYITARLAENPNLVWLNQYTNPANVNAHRRHTAREILDGLGIPDWLFVGTGTGGTLMGCVRELGSTTTVVGVDAVGSVTFGGKPGLRWIPGVGASRKPEIVVDDGSFQKAVIAEIDTIRMCRRVAREYGVLLGGSSGTVLAAVVAFADRIAPGSQVLVISPDMGDNYLDTIYDDDWVTDRFGAHALDIPSAVRNGEFAWQ